MVKGITVRPGLAGASLDDIGEESGNGRVLVKTLYTGVCGTDREIVAGKLSITRAERGDRLVLGHEALGSVMDPGSSSFSKGDLVVPMVRRPGGCANCAAGRQDYCMDGNFTEAGIRGKDGFMRESFYEEERFLVKAGSGSAGIEKILTEPMKNVMKIRESIFGVIGRGLWDSVKDKGAWIFGTGTEGLLIGSVLSSVGMRVMLVNRHGLPEIAQELARHIGAEFFNSASGDWASGENAVPMDMVVDAAGAPSILLDAVRNIRHTGVIVLFGTGGAGIEEKLNGGTILNMVDKNLTVIGCEDGAREHYEQAVDFISENGEKYGLGKLITGIFPPEDASVLSAKQVGEIKSVIKW